MTSTRRVSTKDKDKEDERKSDNKDICEKCKTKVEASHCGLLCELCEVWFHIKCVTVSRECYEALKNVPGSHWFCDTCNIKVNDVIQGMLRTSERLEQVIKKQTEYDNALVRAEARQEMLENKVNAVTKELSQIRDEINKRPSDSEVEAKLNEKMESKEPSWRDIVERQVEVKFTEVTDNLIAVKKNLDETKRISEEEKDRDNRRNNIIIYRLSESSAASPDDRRKEDFDMCLTLVRDTLGVDCTAEDIKKVIRLGQRDRQNTDRCRPVLIEFRQYSTKNQTMEFLYKLKDAPAHLHNLSVTHDLTKNEREEIKTKVEEAKERELNESGDYIWRVRGNPGFLKIVRLRRRE